MDDVKGRLAWPAAYMRTARIEIMSNARKILIVEDDPELRAALAEQLSLHDEFEPVAAVNGSAAIQAAKAEQINLLIMDIGLPDLDGRDVVQREIPVAGLFQSALIKT